MAKDDRIIRPMNGLGPVKGPGDRARAIIHTAKVARQKAAGDKPPAFKAGFSAPSKVSPPMSKRTSAPKRLTVSVGRVGAATRQMASQRAPVSRVGPNRAGASFTPGSKADMAFTGIKPGAAAAEVVPAARMVAPRRIPVKKLGTGPVGMALTAGAAAAGMAIHDKVRSRKVKK